MAPRHGFTLSSSRSNAGNSASNLKGRTRKQQYWILEDGRWKIAYEATMRPARLVLPESYPERTRTP